MKKFTTKELLKYVPFMELNISSKLLFKKPLSQRIYMGGYVVCMLLSIPSLTFSVIFNRDTSHMGFLYILSIVFAIKIIRYLVISRCIRAYHMKRSLKLPAVSLFWAFIKPSLVHIPLVGLPAILAAGAAGDLKSSAIGIGAGLSMVLISYIFAIDIPFRIKSEIKDFSQ